MKSPKPKLIAYVKAGILIVDQVKPAILKLREPLCGLISAKASVLNEPRYFGLI